MTHLVLVAGFYLCLFKFISILNFHITEQYINIKRNNTDVPKRNRVLPKRLEVRSV